MEGALIYLILIGIVVFRFLRSGGAKPGSDRRPSVSRPSASPTSPASPAGRTPAARRPLGGGRGPLASDGHRMSGEDDVSCRRFGHRHEEFDTPRYIPHDDPEDGFIILNGVKMRLSDADRYEDRI